MVNYGDVNDVADTTEPQISQNGDTDGGSEPSVQTQDDILSHFQEVTGKTEVDECLKLLDESNWDLERAVQLSFGGGPATATTPPVSNAPAPPLIESSSSSLSSASSSSNNMSLEGSALRQRNITEYTNPLISTSHPNFIGPRLNSSTGPIINRQNNSITQILMGSLWNILWWPLSIAYKIIYSVVQLTLSFLISPGPPTQRQAGQEVEHYISQFNAKYGSVHPRFYHGTYREAVSHAKRHLRFLLVFLHDDNNATSVSFAKDVVCTNLLKSVVEDNLLFWSCSVKSQEGGCVAESLSNAKAPFIALLCFKEEQMRMVFKNEGHASVESLITRLTASIVENEPHLTRQRRSRDRVSESTSSQLIMQEQDAAYRESLIRDQERARKKKEEEDAIRKIQEEIERQEREKEDKISSREALRRKLKENLEEPTKDHTLSLLFRMPSGSRICRKFPPQATVEDIYNFALTCDECPNFFTLVSNFPKKVLPSKGEAMSKTCIEMGIPSSTTLFIQEAFSDDEEESSEESEAEV